MKMDNFVKGLFNDPVCQCCTGELTAALFVEKSVQNALKWIIR